MPSSSSTFGPKGFAIARSCADNNASADSMAIVEDRPYFPFLAVDPSDERGMIRAAKSVVEAYCNLQSDAGGHVDDADATVATVPGGLTNSLYKIDFPSLSRHSGGGTFLIRLFGAEGMIDRDAETATFARLVDAEGAITHPSLRYIGRFANGRVEAFIPDMRQSELSDIRSPPVYNSVARQLARLHCRFDIPEYLYEKECRRNIDDGRTEMVHFLNVVLDWIGGLEGMMADLDLETVELIRSAVVGEEGGAACDCDCGGSENADAAIPSAIGGEIASYLRRETGWLQSAVPRRHPRAAVAFAHNDLWTQNILMREKESDDSANEDTEVCIIDYEWGMVNYAMYDVANFFCEMCGGNEDGVPDVELFPSRECQEEFLREYIGERGRILRDRGRECQESEDESISELLSQIQLFRMASDLIRGVLATLQACGEILQAGPSFCVEDARLRLDGVIGLDSLDKLRYGKNRLRNYSVCKKAVAE